MRLKRTLKSFIKDKKESIAIKKYILSKKAKNIFKKLRTYSKRSK